MSLRELAEADLGVILGDNTAGFGWPITVTDPEDRSAVLVGFTNDIGQLIDPDTGVAVSGRQASIALRMTSLLAAGLGLPKNIAAVDRKPWRIAFDDVVGETHRFKVIESMPDRALGVVTCLLELYA